MTDHTDSTIQVAMAAALAIPADTPGRQAVLSAIAKARAEVDALVAAAQCLRDAQRAYMADRGNNDLGRLVGIRAEELDAVLAALTPTDARAALRDREEAAVRRALEAAINAAYEADSLELTLHGETKIAERIRALDPAQFIGGGE